MDAIAELNSADMDPVVWADVNEIDIRKRGDWASMWHDAVYFCMRTLYMAIWVFTFSACSPSWRTKWFTVGNTIYHPPSRKPSTERFARMVVHESTHVFQWREDGPVKYILKYFVFPLPILWSGKADYEAEAYGNQVIRGALNGGLSVKSCGYYADLICSADYGWASLDRDGIFYFLLQCYRQANLGIAKSVEEVRISDKHQGSKYVD